MNQRMKSLHLIFNILVFVLVINACNLPPSNQIDPTPTQPKSTPFIVTHKPTPILIQPSVEIIGTEEVVYDWTRNRCADDMLPDLPVRAFRDAEGKVQLNISFESNYRMVGDDLDSLQSDCNPTLLSHEDPDPAKFNFREWIGSTYTLDGKTVYALVHNEFHGNVAAGRVGFNKEQGVNGWYYQSWNGSVYRDMQYNPQKNLWQGSRSWCQFWPGIAHPDGYCEATKTWISPKDGVVTITGGASDADSNGGDGVIVKILKGDEELWSEIIENGDMVGYKFNLNVSVQEGDTIHIRVNQRGNSNNDATNLFAEIDGIGHLCPSTRRDICQMGSVTYAKSTDGGKTFIHPEAPDHLVASLPFPYEPDGGLIGPGAPSNIVKSPKDGYYYALLQIDIHRPPNWIQGTCVMRTKTLDDPKSWRAWDGEGFNMRFINPYLEPDADPDKHTCEFIPVNNTGALSFNLTYNTYLEKFIAVGIDVNKPIHGFYYNISDDLIHWSNAWLLMEIELSNTEEPFYGYPTLVDPDSTSINFETTGQTPYLYYTRFNTLWSHLDFDLVRVQIKFNK